MKQPRSSLTPTEPPSTDAWGGLYNAGSRGEFDSVNERYGLRGKRRVKNIAQAVSVAIPKPFCLDKIDLDVLNETAPGREIKFKLPYDVEEAIASRRYAEHYEQFAGWRHRRKR